MKYGPTKSITLALLGLCATLALLPAAHAAAQGVTLQTDTFALVLGNDGRTAAFIDQATGIDYHATGAANPFASVVKGYQRFYATSAALHDDVLTVQFAGAPATATFRVTPGPGRLVFEVTGLHGDGCSELQFARVPLTLVGDLSEPFGASPLALNIQTNCSQIPGLSPTLGGFTAVERFGFVGAQGAIVAAPVPNVRNALKDAVSAAPGLPHSTLGGPFALDAPITRGSYLIDASGTVSAQNVNAWIDAAQRVGATQIDFHGGNSFRHGDFLVNTAIYPDGRAGLAAVVDTIHAAGLAVGMHTYAFFVSKETPWVTPVPDSRLGSNATFTLTGNLGSTGATVGVNESTAGMSTVVGFQVRNSVTLRIDNELITYSGVTQSPPFAFTGCVRGAYGTTRTSHAAGARVYHLRECFGLFVPDGDSTLFTEVAQRTAGFYNE